MAVGPVFFSSDIGLTTLASAKLARDERDRSDTGKMTNG